MGKEALDMVGSRVPRAVKQKLATVAKARGTNLSQLVASILIAAADGAASSGPPPEESRAVDSKQIALLEALLRELRSSRAEVTSARGDLEALAKGLHSEREHSHAAHADMYEALLLLAAEVRSRRFTPEEARDLVDRCFRNRARTV